MTIDEAISRIDNFEKRGLTKNYLELHEALRMGIEALKRIQESRQLKCQVASDTLPGETEK